MPNAQSGVIEMTNEELSDHAEHLDYQIWMLFGLAKRLRAPRSIDSEAERLINNLRPSPCILARDGFRDLLFRKRQCVFISFDLLYLKTGFACTTARRS